MNNIYSHCPRSDLLPLAPIGISDSYMVESLSSYLTRVATMHYLPLRWFLRDYLNPIANQGNLSDDIFDRYGFSAINGYREKAAAYLSAIQKATGRFDLWQLTTTPWQTLLDTRGKGLFAKQKKWCRACFHDWLADNSPLYEPLIWSLESVKTCPRHNCLLMSVCSICNNQQKLVSSVLPVGYCSSCGGFLGKGESSTKTLSSKETYIVKMVAERRRLMQCKDLKKEFVIGIQHVLSASNLSSTLKLERTISFSRDTISQWCSNAKRGTRPTMSSLLCFCDAIGVSPDDLLLNHKNIIVNLKEAKIERRQELSKEKCKEVIFRALVIVVESQKDIIPLSKVAKDLDVGKRFLEYNFPVLVKQLIFNNNKLRSERKKSLEH
ncbi:hypothetical protein EOPP23_14800 [Endozoicomonas sp. OPT23]|uniref:TniQ family protein n=1 Tax=Endozoicomonas sp. OPT23 TaxID=2072845 RepID=UPI00129B9EEF|nr:TniQ family protein [Endozoicomonas sp. OPT23]MRI34261.1 hypothetical protein [Endozoicomonas sp. OPT23]